MNGTSNPDKTDQNEQDDLGLRQFSPVVLEFILGIVRARKGMQAKTETPEFDKVVAPP